MGRFSQFSITTLLVLTTLVAIAVAMYPGIRHRYSVEYEFEHYTGLEFSDTCVLSQENKTTFTSRQFVGCESRRIKFELDKEEAIRLKYSSPPWNPWWERKIIVLVVNKYYLK